MTHLRTRVFAACAIVALAASLSACTKVSTSGSSGGQANSFTHPGVLRIADLSDPETLNPIVGNQQIDVDLSMFWAGYLFNYNDQNEFVPELATEMPTQKNGGISPDGKTIRYKLRTGVKWHDGQPFTADDVIFTWQAIMSPKTNIGSRVGYDLIAAIDKTDDHDIVVHLKKPWSPFTASFFTMSGTPYPVLPKHVLAQYPDINRVPFNSEPIGTGPFKVAKWERGQRIQFVANPDYWRGAPKLKEVDYQPIGDENTIATLIKTGAVDMDFNVSSSLYPQYQNVTGFNTMLVPFNQYAQIGFNLKSGPLADPNVRRALVYGTDRKNIIDTVTHGVEVENATDQPDFSWAHNPNLKPIPYDPAKARQLLDAAGWKVGANGIRQKGGQPLSIVLAGTTGSATNRQASVLLQRWWRDIGVDTQIKTFTSSLYFASYGGGGILQTGKFDAGFFSWVNGVDPDDSTLVLCNQFPPGGQNIYRYCNPKLDALEAQALASYERSARQRAYWQIQNDLVADNPWMMLYFARRVVVVNKDLKGFKPAHAVTEFWNPWEWEI